MAKQLNLLSTGQVITTALHAEMQRSYLEYAMSVIVGRALPDVRDGLKPVHRRILYAMHELGLVPDRPYRKCARVVGDVLGKYHPHGDQAVYDALVRMVQDFSCRYPLLAGHGNFGSVDNDPPAAMRYTETRLAPISHEALLSEIGEATVDFIPNFDNSQQEPVVLPAQLPILLLNGCAGIAVGMATNVPPHNLGEVVDGLIALIDRPDLSEDKLLELIPGPDFPTGGEIVGTEGIREAYTTSKGSIPVRGVAKIEEIARRSSSSKSKAQNRTAIVVTELPFQVNKASWIEKVAELVNQGKIEGIGDLRDESDREGMRVVVEIKRDANAQEVLEQLYKQTALCSNFGAILLALVEGQPRQLTLRQMLLEFLSFREQTLTRQYNHELQQCLRRLHLVEGLLTALSNLDAVIQILRNAPDGTTAKLSLQSQFNFSDRQSDAILSMPLRRLTGLERQQLQTEFDELRDRIAQLERLLSDRHEFLKALKKDLRTLKRKYGDPRRTRILATPAAAPEQPRSTAALEQRGTTAGGQKKEKSKTQEIQQPTLFTPPPPEEVTLEFTHKGYVRRLSKNGNKSSSLKSQDDFVVNTQAATTQTDLVVVTASGKAYPVNVGDIPPTSGGNKGTPLCTLLPGAKETPEMLVGQFVLPDNLETGSLVLCTQQGRIKRVALSELANLTRRGATLLKLKDDDRLLSVHAIASKGDVVMATSGGRLLRLRINDEQLPITSRSTQGLQALRLLRSEQVVGASILLPNDSLLLATQLGYVKRLPISAMPLAQLGNIGTTVFQFTTKSDALAGIVVANASSEVILMTNTQRTQKLPVDKVKFWGKDGTGDRLIALKAEEKVINLLIA
ncbi:DNA topoisomerase 4 subunit A [Planktothrix sp. FACHB-1355]|uniref:DNA topoisomerase (ATP-hydrolyzing) n=1 Tax=Aerosakkonema funiforme FACHB-1375 TaxID=2949571 RepID=A0A926VFP1_9CYAN|nr:MULTISPECIES: DNA topoisomerase (ATP-hydrolyzing) [Oscillatoriales]MBD2182805.1 DNA topoisomerase 4 subunit A [Aerosakkonema funiforme FACHB-1375]MBD3558025.1 DNA topoisomerase 4 subunit A [Planktothrix sp. FACHB-1355]